MDISINNRHKGKTTSLVNEAINSFFLNGFALIIDHHPDGHRIMCSKFCSRLQYEHGFSDKDYHVRSFNNGYVVTMSDHKLKQYQKTKEAVLFNQRKSVNTSSHSFRRYFK